MGSHLLPLNTSSRPSLAKPLTAYVYNSIKVCSVSPFLVSFGSEFLFSQYLVYMLYIYTFVFYAIIKQIRKNYWTKKQLIDYQGAAQAILPKQDALRQEDIVECQKELLRPQNTVRLPLDITPSSSQILPKKFRRNKIPPFYLCTLLQDLPI